MITDTVSETIAMLLAAKRGARKTGVLDTIEIPTMTEAEWSEAKAWTDDGTARRIAAQLHSGQASALYSLASTGAIDEDRLYREIDGMIDVLPGVVRRECLKNTAAIGELAHR